MKILVIGDANSIFVYEYISEVLADKKYQITIFNITGKSVGLRESYMNYYETREIKLINTGINNTVLFHKTNVILSRLHYMLQLVCCREYDVIDILFVHKDYFPITYFIKKNSKLILTIFGSDLLRESKSGLKVKEKLFNRANTITVETDYFFTELEKIYGKKYMDKVIKIGMGNKYVELIDYILKHFSKEDCKKKFLFPKDKLVVFCGYSGSPEHKHIEILDILEKQKELKDNQIFIVFHCAYSLSTDYEEVLKRRIKNSRFEGVLLKNYLVNEDLIHLRMCADVMLNLQRTDAISSSMLENLAVGSIVVKGDWLVYPELEQSRAFLLSIAKMDELGKCIENIIINYEDYKKSSYRNKEIVYKRLSWKYKLDTWKKIIDV